MYKLTSIVGLIMSTKQVTEPTTNVETTVDKLEADLTYLEKLDINGAPQAANRGSWEAVRA